MNARFLFTGGGGVDTISVMNEPESMVPLQISIRKPTRKRLKNAANDADLTMSELGEVLLDYSISLVESGKVPPTLAALIEKAKKAKAKKDSES